MTRRALFLFPADRMGGAEQVTRMLAKEAATCGSFDQVHCFILCWSRSGTLDELEKLGNVTLHYSGAANHRKGLIPCIRFLMRQNYDFVFSTHTHLNSLTSLLRRLRLLRTNWLVTRESTPIFERDFGPLSSVVRLFYWAYGAQDLIVCQSERMLASFNTHTHDRYSKKLKVIPNPIDFDRIADAKNLELPSAVNAIPSNCIKIIWCGRFVPVKAPIRAVETLQALHDAGRTDIHLLMIGDGPLFDDVKTAIKRLKLTEFVTLTGFYPTPATIMARCDFGLLTSDKEGFPNVILEMLASGVLAVVTTDCSGGLDSIPNLFVTKTHEPAQLAKRLLVALAKVHLADADTYLKTRNPAEYWRTIMMN